MYFWKTPELVAELRTEALAEKDFKSYYLASSVLTSVCVYLAMLESRENMYALGLEAAVAVAITILGINAAFKANGGATGKRFVEKAVSISFPLLIKVLIAGFFLGLIVGFSMAFGLSKCQSEWVSAIGSVAIQAAFVWRLIIHVKATNA